MSPTSSATWLMPTRRAVMPGSYARCELRPTRTSVRTPRLVCSMANQSKIVVSGAREHNLKDVSLELPRDALVVITGLSGSGKSSLAFDTIYAEGQRRYVESLSAYARQFLGQMDKPDVDSIEGLSPAISIDQKTTSRNPRSTVGTVTEIYDYLRLLWARIGKPHCHVCGAPIEGQSVEQIVDRVLERDPGAAGGSWCSRRSSAAARASTASSSRSCAATATRARWSTASCGCSRRRSSSTSATSTTSPSWSTGSSCGRRCASACTESVEAAVGLADGLVEVAGAAGRDGEAPRSARALLRALRLPALRHLDARARAADLLVQLAARRVRALHRPGLADGDRPRARRARTRTLSIARARWRRGRTARRTTTSSSPRRSPSTYGVDLDVAVAQSCRRRERDLFLYGTDGERMQVTYRNRYGRTRTYATRFEGIVPNLERRYRETDSEFSREKIEEYMSVRPCPECHGSRLRPESRSVLVGGHGDPRVHGAERPARARRGSTRLELSETERHIARLILREIDERLRFLDDVGIGYLSMDRGGRDAVGRRGAADPAGDADRLGAGRRALRARRAVDRPAPARQLEAHRDARAAARPRQHGARRRARRADDARGRLPRRPRPGRGRARRADRRAGHGRGGRGGPGVADRAVPVGQAVDRGAGEAAQADRVRRDRRRAAEQPQERRRPGPARRPDVRHRRVGLGQVDARQRHPLQGGGQPPAPRAVTRPGAHKSRARASTSSTRSSRSTSRRSGARRGPTRRRTRASST